MSVVAGQVRAFVFARGGRRWRERAPARERARRGGAGESGRPEDGGVHAWRSGRVVLFVRAFEHRADRRRRGPPGAPPSPPPAAPRGARRPEPARAKWAALSTRAQRPEPRPRVPMATRVLSLSARLGPVPQPPAPQDEPVFAQLKPVLGAANPARDAALFGEELKHPHHHPQAQPPQPAPPPAPGPRLPPEELVQVGSAAPLPPARPPSRGSGVSRRCDARATGAAPGWGVRRGSPGAGAGWAAPPCPPGQSTPFRREKVDLKGGGCVGGGPLRWICPGRSVRERSKGSGCSRAPLVFFLHLEDQTSYLSPKLNCALRLHPPLLPVQWPWKCPPVARRLVLSGNANRGAGRGPPRGPIFLTVGSPRSRRDGELPLGGRKSKGCIGVFIYIFFYCILFYFT